MRRLVVVFRLLTLPGLAAIAVTGLPGAFRSQPLYAQPWPTSSALLADSQSVIGLANHLKKVGAKMYGAYWCPYCKRQSDLFGQSAFQAIEYIECDPRGKQAQPQVCQAEKIQGYPTWKINGKTYTGVQSLEDLAEASGYKGPRKF